MRIGNSVITFPFTVTRPCCTISSTCRREATPALARTFWMRSFISRLYGRAQSRMSSREPQIIDHNMRDYDGPQIAACAKADCRAEAEDRSFKHRPDAAFP